MRSTKSRLTKRDAHSPDLPPRGQSPIGHLPYPEGIGIEAEGRCRGGLLSPVPGVPTRSRRRGRTPTPLSHYLAVPADLTLITYPETEPLGHREGRNSGGGVGVNGGVDSEEKCQ